MVKVKKETTKYHSYHWVAKGLDKLSECMEVLQNEKIYGDIIQMSVTPQPIPNSTMWYYNIVFTTTKKHEEITYNLDI